MWRPRWQTHAHAAAGRNFIASLKFSASSETHISTDETKFRIVRLITKHRLFTLHRTRDSFTAQCARVTMITTTLRLFDTRDGRRKSADQQFRILYVGVRTRSRCGNVLTDWWYMYSNVEKSERREIWRGGERQQLPPTRGPVVRPVRTPHAILRVCTARRRYTCGCVRACA